MLCGEAGIGKTRTLAELGRYARELGFSVWAGAADDSHGAPAYWPWTELLRACCEELSLPVWTQHLPANCVGLPALVPELFRGASLEERPDASSLRFLLFDELTRFLRSLAAAAPRLIVLEDLHWADTATVELLAYAARNLDPQRILFVASFREPVSTLDGSHGAALRRLTRLARRISLRGLSAEEIRELVCALRGVQLSADALRLMEQRTRGNPFVIRQTLDLLTDREQTPDESTLAALTMPPAVRDIVAQRLAPLPDATRNVLAVAAVIGQSFDPWLLADVLGEPLERTLSALELALHMGLLECDAGASPRFRFDHALVRDSLYEELALAERGALHAKVAHALTLRDASQDARQLAEIARHFLCSVPADLDACSLHCDRAATAARAASGFEAAADLLSRLLQKFTLEGGSNATRCELMLTLGIDRYCAGDIEGAFHTLQQGAELAQRDQPATLLARFVFRLLDCLETAYGDEAYVRELLEQALREVGDRDPRVRAALLARRAQIGRELPHADRLKMLEEADALAKSGDADDLLQLEIATCRASLRDPTQLEHNANAARKLRVLLAEQPPQRLAIRLRTFAGIMTEYVCALTSCELEAADAVIRRANDLLGPENVAGLQPVQTRLLVALMMAGRALGDGRFEDLERHIEALRELCALLSGQAALAWVLYTCLLAEARGDQQILLNLTSVSLPPIVAEQTRQQLYSAIFKTWLYAKAGRCEDARESLASISGAELARMPTEYGDLGLLCMLTEIHEILGQIAGVERLYHQLAPHAALNAVGPCLEYRGSVAYYVGILAAMLGNAEEAARSMERARAVNARLKMPVHLARAQTGLKESVETKTEA